MALKNRLHRSELAVPGSNLRMLEKAPTLGADVVFLDLEDAVASVDKIPARANVIHALNCYDWSHCSVSVRINGLDTCYAYRDIIEVVEAAGDKLDTILIPKANAPQDVLFVARLLEQIEMAMGFDPIGVHILIETALGVTNIESIARCCPERLEAMVFGAGDYAASVQARNTSIGGPNPDYAVLADADAEGNRLRYWGDQWHYVLSRMIAACRAYGLRPIDSAFGDFSDPEGYRAAARAFAALGGEGKWAIHPSQIAIANEVFTPGDAEVAHARRILNALAEAEREGRGAVSLDGRMIDGASLRQAQMLVEKAEKITVAGN